MTRSSKLLWTAALGAFLIAAVTSCNETKDQEAAEHSTTATTTDNGAATTMQGNGAVQVVAVDLGRTIGTDKQVTERIDTFKPNDTVYASIHTSGNAPNSKLGVKWYQNGQVVSQSEQPIVEAEGTNAMEFHLSQPSGLPAGEYKVEVTVDGNTVQTKEFKVSAS